MTPETPEAAFKLLREFFTERRASRDALKHLREGVEIEIVIGEMVACAVFRRDANIAVEERRAVNPDFTFRIRPETVSILARETPDDVGDVGLGVIKEILAGDIKVSMNNGFRAVLRNGYFDILASGGKPIANHLRELGLTSPMRIFNVLRGRR